jgi:hypothetical protein
MALFTQSTTKKVRSSTCLQADKRGLQVRCESNQLLYYGMRLGSLCEFSYQASLSLRSIDKNG